MQTSLFPTGRAWDRRMLLENLSDLQTENEKEAISEWLPASQPEPPSSERKQRM